MVLNFSIKVWNNEFSFWMLNHSYTEKSAISFLSSESWYLESAKKSYYYYSYFVDFHNWTSLKLPVEFSQQFFCLELLSTVQIKFICENDLLYVRSTCSAPQWWKKSQCDSHIVCHFKTFSFPLAGWKLKMVRLEILLHLRIWRLRWSWLLLSRCKWQMLESRIALSQHKLQDLKFWSAISPMQVGLTLVVWLQMLLQVEVVDLGLDVFNRPVVFAKNDFEYRGKIIQKAFFGRLFRSRFWNETQCWWWFNWKRFHAGMFLNWYFDCCKDTGG